MQVEWSIRVISACSGLTISDNIKYLVATLSNGLEYGFRVAQRDV